MPGTRIIRELNLALAPEGIRVLKTEVPAVVELLSHPGSLLTVADKILGMTPEDREYITAIPVTIQESLRAAICQAIEQDKGVHVQYSPAYDFEVRMWDYGPSLIVNIRGPLAPPYARDAVLPERDV